MAIRKILTEPNKILREKSLRVENVDQDIQRLMDDMLETLYAAPGIGLAAIQVGVAKRIIVMDISRSRNDIGRDKDDINKNESIQNFSGSAFEDVANIFSSLSALVPVAQCGLHLHDNQGQASESVRLAWERGVRHFDSAAGGRGGCPFAPGAGGNLSTSVLVDVAGTLGAECGIKSGSLREAEDFLAEALETRISGDA